MSPLPENLPAWVAMLKKHHFWLLALAVPLVVLPFLFIANSHLLKQIGAKRGEIKAHLLALKRVESIPNHPNKDWTTDIEASTAAVKREMLNEWQRFWDRQQPVRIWPEILGPDFVEKAAALKPDAKLPLRLLEQYQDGVPKMVRQLPARMGAKEQMLGDDAKKPGAAVAASSAVVTWTSENQQSLYRSFDWEKSPSTAQVVLAQEELWAYGLLCDVIARINKEAAGAYNAPIPVVEEVFVGYKASEDKPGGVGSGRIMKPMNQGQLNAATAPTGGEEPGAMPLARLERPPHPRFGGGDPVPSRSSDGPRQPSAPDDALKNWVYVDFLGTPLMAADISSSLGAQMVHLMPFIMKVIIDQRSLDALLVDLATLAPVPIDVRQVRINAAGNAAIKPNAAAEPTATGGAPVRLYDIHVELRGTIALATPPNNKSLGVESSEKPDASPPSGGTGKPGRQPATPVNQAEPDATLPAVEPLPADTAPVESPPVPPQPEPNPPTAADHKSRSFLEGWVVA